VKRRKFNYYYIVKQNRHIYKPNNINNNMINKETRFKRSTPLNEALDELRYNGCTEITRIMFDHEPLNIIIEYNVEDLE